MREVFINSAEDMQWLRDVHLPQLDESYKSAIIFGNEDWPTEIHVFKKSDPLVHDECKIFVPDHDGNYVEVAARKEQK